MTASSTIAARLPTDAAGTGAAAGVAPLLMDGADADTAAGTAARVAAPSDGAPQRIGGAALPEFRVRLSNFDGPFDLLLSLIGAHRLDVTEVALSQVTDEFLSYLGDLGEDADLGVVTEFLVVAATLLDLKAARLLPDADVEDAGDVAALEARDLLFARLLAYRAYQQVATLFAELEAVAPRRYPRAVALEPRYFDALPELRIDLDATGFAQLAASVFRPRPAPQVQVEHLHATPVSVAEHTQALRVLLADLGQATFADLTADCAATLQVVARFLGLLQLYRDSAVTFDQPEPLGELLVRWQDRGTAGAEDTAPDGETDEYAGGVG